MSVTRILCNECGFPLAWCACKKPNATGVAGAAEKQPHEARCAEATGSVSYDANSIDHNWWGDVPDYDHWEDACVCDRCGGEGFYEYNDGDGSDWGEDCPSEENHLITCRKCHGTGEIK
jgi:hypothetical protein